MKQQNLFDEGGAAVVAKPESPDCKFDRKAALEKRDEAIKQVASSSWLVQFVDAVRNTANCLPTFTTDDVLIQFPELEACAEKRVMGAAVRFLSQCNVIEATGRYVDSDRKASHGRPKREWKKKSTAG